MTEALVNPEIMLWARHRAGVSAEELARKVGLSKPERISAWERGEERPTFVQAHKVADVLHVPFGYLFLHSLPSSSTVSLPDLRTTSRRRHQVSVNLQDVYDDACWKQDWMRSEREAADEPVLAFVGSAAGGTDIGPVADSIRQIIGLDAGLRSRTKNGEDFLAALVTSAEKAGLLVLRAATVGSNSHRKLDVDEFRGFAIADRLAPLVFINTADARPAQLFTLIHELAHIWRAETGISRPDIESSDAARPDDIERFCDAVAAEVLVPASELTSLVVAGEALADACRRLAKHFGVSQLVVARRLFDLGILQRDAFQAFVTEQFALAHARKARQKESKGGPGFLMMTRQRNGARLTQAVVSAARAGRLLYRDAAHLLSVQPRHIDALAEGD